MSHARHKCCIDAAAASIIQKKYLSCSGLKTNEEKCHREPMQIGEWLGMIINTINSKFRLEKSSTFCLPITFQDSK
jgi:hypothetical protein